MITKTNNPTELILQISELSKTYNNGVHALKHINLEVQKGDFFALLGANGAGKSTTIGLITSLLSKSSGSISIDGFDIDTHPQDAKSKIGLVPQEFNMNIFETSTQILLNQAGYYGLKRHEVRDYANELLHQLGLWEKRDAIVRHLSGGMKRRLMIARALIHKPALLILDEPTAGVDIEIRRSMWRFLKRINDEGISIILTTHYLEEAEQLCKNIAIIVHGEIVTHTSMSELLKSLNYHTLIFDTPKPLDFFPDLSPFEGRKIDDHTFEVRFHNQYMLNELFDVFNQHNIKINGIRNKSNRLEELFLDLINHD